VLLKTKTIPGMQPLIAVVHALGDLGTVFRVIGGDFVVGDGG
jgi:hypothetical protein